MKTLTVNEKVDNAIMWIDSLAKTKVKQGQSQLGNSKEGYCCLGWACKKLKVNYNYQEEFNKEVIDLMGLKTKEGCFIRDKDSKSYEDLGNNIELNGTYYGSIADINDTDGRYNFKDISNIIKDNLSLLFEPMVAHKLIEHYKTNASTGK